MGDQKTEDLVTQAKARDWLLKESIVIPLFFAVNGLIHWFFFVRFMVIPVKKPSWKVATDIFVTTRRATGCDRQFF